MYIIIHTEIALKADSSPIHIPHIGIPLVPVIISVAINLDFMIMVTFVNNSTVDLIVLSDLRYNYSSSLLLLFPYIFTVVSFLSQESSLEHF